ncbi:MAG: DUF3526 domain-containing protein [Bacteroidota bacterium]|nr:DUF3526 domain-containing protein [Bacteroidota bacterium]
MKQKISSRELVKIQYWLFVKQKTNWLLLIVFLSAGMYALYQGFAFKAKQISTIHSFREEKSSNLNDMVSGFQADTTTVEGKEAYQKVTEVNQANWYTVLPAYKIPNTTAIYSIGQGDVFPYYYTVKLESFFMQLFKQNEITNPLRSLAGHFDTSFWVIYLLPLLIIVLGFNILSAELDNGNWRLINSQGVSPKHWVRSKMLLIANGVGSLFLIIFFIGIMINYIYFNQLPAITDLLFFVGVYLYLGFWLSVLYLINAFGLNTSASALYSGILWVLICIIMPALVTTVIEKVVSVDNTLVSRMSRRPQGSKFEDDAFGIKTIKQFGELKPQYKDATIEPKSKLFRFSVYFAYHELLDDSNRVVVQHYFDNIEQRQSLTNASGVINPAASIDGIFAGLAFNDAEANHRFIWSMKDFHGRLRDAFFPALFYDRSLNESDYKKLPSMDSSVKSQSASLMILIYYLAFIIMIILPMRWASKKFKVLPKSS